MKTWPTRLALLSGEKTDSKLKDFWNYGRPHAAEYTALMAASQEAVAAEILAAYDFAATST